MKELELIKKQLKETKNIIITQISLLNEKIKFLEQENGDIRDQITEASLPLKQS